ncbi:MAG: anti-sigma E factor RseA [Mycobacterium sp.]
MVGAPRQFSSTEHLSTEAIAAYVGGELWMTAHLRAARHLSLRPQCAAEVDTQMHNSATLSDSLPPSALLGMLLLAQIPQHSAESAARATTLADPLAHNTGRHRRRRR